MSDAHRDDIAKLETLYAEHPGGRIFTHLAEAYRKAGELDRAQQVLTDGIERHPDYSSAHVVLGRVYMDRDHTDEAETEFRRVLELDAHNLIAIRALGDLARARGADEEALQFYRRLLDQEPADEEVRDIVAELTGAPAAPAAEPGPAPEPALADDPTFADEPASADEPALAGMTEPAGASGDVDAYEGEPDQGPGAEEEAAALEPGAADAALQQDTELRTETIAQVYARQGLYDRAAEVYRQLVGSRPGDEGLRERLAEMEQLAAAQEGSAGEVAAVSDFDGSEPEPAAASDPGVDPLPGLEGTGSEIEPEPPAGATVEGLESMEMDPAEAGAETLEGLTVDEADPETGLRSDAPPESATPDEDLSEELAVGDVPEPPEELPWEETVWTEEDWADVGEEPTTPHAWTEDEDEVDTSPPIRDYFSGLLDWAGAVATAGGASAEAAGGRAEPTGSPGLPGSAAQPEAAGSSETPPEEDDDLEMFRSWLESLKQ